jgi:hypothetical protein
MYITAGDDFLGPGDKKCPINMRRVLDGYGIMAALNL